MTVDIISAFRDEANEDELIYHIFKNKDGKNKWSIICSAMDWIEVVIEKIDLKNVQRGNDNESSVKLMTFISCIDVLWESIQQLHRVLFNTESIPFSDDTSVFKHKLIETTDNDYFKTIRACFAAHPVNLNDHFRDPSKKERRYASWSSGGIASTGDFTVFLYSNLPGVEMLMLDISFRELLSFAKMRYEYLGILTEQLKKIKLDYLSSMKGTIIRPSDTLTHINVLKEENSLRFENDYYDYELSKLERIFSIRPINLQNAELLLHYQTDLIPVIEEIHANLENMTLKDLKTAKVVGPDIPPACQYYFADLVSSVYGDGTAYIWGLEPFVKSLKGIVDFKGISSLEELYVLLLAGFYRLESREQ